MLARALAWLDDRSGYREAVRRMLDEKVPGGASFAYVFGSILTFLLGLQFATGIVLAFYYSPSVTDAWGSVAYLQDNVTLGWFVRGLHGYGASAIVIIAGLHLFQTALYGAYKRPRELNWIVGVLLLGVLLAFALTGYLLPWDQTGYWATKVATGIAGTSPVIGQELQAAVQGGNEYGNLTLTRFFAIHVFVLPALLIALLVLHIALFRRHGVTRHFWVNERDAALRVAPFWPDQLWKDMLAMAIVFTILLVLNVQSHGVPLGAPADPASNFDARPEWYFRPLFQALKYFSGPLEMVVALGLPVVVGGILLAMPFLDRGTSHHPRHRILYLVPLAVLGLLSVLLTVLSFVEDKNDPQLQERLVSAEKRGAAARALAKVHGVPAAGPLHIFTAAQTSVDRGRKLWNDECKSCHDGAERSAPEITRGYNSRAWIRAFLVDPSGDRFFGKTSITTMEPVKLTGKDLDAAVEAIYAESGAADVDASLAALGRERIEKGQPDVKDSAWDCNGCHPGFDYEKEAETGPNLARRGSRDMLAEFIGRSSHPRWFGKDSEMPDTYDELSRAERLDLADFLLSLRK